MISRLTLLIVGLSGMPLLNAADVPALGEYAYGFRIQLQESQSQPQDFNSIEVPLILYQSVSDPGLRDLGVYDAAGQPVPRVLQPRKQLPAKPEVTTILRTFALPGGDTTSAEDIKLLLRRSDGATNVELNTTSGGDTQQRYLVDTQDLEQPLKALEFAWNRVSETFVANVSIEGSQDLDDWVTIGTGAIADLQGETGVIKRRRVAIEAKRYNYLRVNVTGMPEGFRLSATAGIRLAEPATVVRRWTTLDSSGQDEDGGLLFELSGSVPVDRVQVLIRGNNSAVRGRLYTWSRDRWTNSQAGVFYNLRRNGAGVTNEPLAVTERRGQRWKLNILTGRSDGPVQLKLGWRPEHLIFLAQGEAPYTLASGRAADREDNFPHARLYGDLAIFNLALGSDADTIAAASLGSRQLLGGDGRLVMPVKRNWQQGLLWAVLILAVVVVGWIAVNLLRQLNNAEP
jgi:hypothetical protein